MKIEYSEVLICYGDSNTYGFDPEPWSAGRYPADSRWPELLGKSLGIDVVNAGENGREVPGAEDRIRGALKYLEGFSEQYARRNVLLMLGSNDLLNGKTASRTAARMEEFLRALRESIPADRGALCLIAPPVMEYGTWVCRKQIYEESRRLEAAYAEAARKTDSGFIRTGDWGIPVASDGVHFTEEGHRKFAAQMLRAVRDLLKGSGKGGPYD